MTYDQWLRLTELPIDEANAAMSGEPRVTEYKARFTGRANPDVGHFMHEPDHAAALRVILGREPTWAEVWGSLFSEDNVNRAWFMTLLLPDGAPENWALDDGTEERRYLRNLTAVRFLHGNHSYAFAAAVLDGKRRDPSPNQTAEQMAAWDAIAARRSSAKPPPSPPPPSPPPPPPPPPEPQPEPKPAPEPTPPPEPEHTPPPAREPFTLSEASLATLREVEGWISERRVQQRRRVAALVAEIQGKLGR